MFGRNLSNFECFASNAKKISKEIFVDVSVNTPVITMVGRKELFVENYSSVMNIDKEAVKILTKKGILIIKGDKLDIAYIDSDELSVKGDIHEIQYD
ncbi:MAG: YabP/YqfC family sporulation protein [Lachnospira sp.]